jgi:hypothetical protein
MSEQAVAQEVSVEQRLEKLEEAIAKLDRRHTVHKEIAEELRDEVRAFKNSNSSRTGYPGSRGEKGETGSPGRDCHIEIRSANGKVQIVDLDSGKVAAEIFAIPGKDGRDGVSPAPARDGHDGKDGVSPSVEEIVAKVVAVLAARLK